MTGWLDSASWWQLALALVAIYVWALATIRMFCHAAALGWGEGANDARKDEACDDARGSSDSSTA